MSADNDSLALEDLLLHLRHACGLRGDAEREVANLLFSELMACRIKLADSPTNLRSLTTEQILRAPLDQASFEHWAVTSVTGRRLRARFPALAAWFVDVAPDGGVAA